MLTYLCRPREEDRWKIGGPVVVRGIKTLKNPLFLRYQGALKGSNAWKPQPENTNLINTRVTIKKTKIKEMLLHIDAKYLSESKRNGIVFTSDHGLGFNSHKNQERHVS